MRYWIIAIVITLAAAYYQRVTGPEYPKKGKSEFAGWRLSYKLGRTHAGEGDQRVAIAVPDSAIRGILYWKRYPTRDAFTGIPMQRRGDTLVAFLPRQPLAGKLQYRFRLRYGDHETLVPADGPVITRFRGDIPAYLLAPHILLMFLAMLWANRAGIEALRRDGNLLPYTRWTVVLLFLGGMVLGPIVQKYAFGEFWTGVPFGWDLTDNKTLIALLGWLAAWWRLKKNPQARSAVLAAAILMLAVYLIPHSVMGSEYKYE